ncbi:FMN-linked oxidoreductase [Aspergillus steynii IBT 23096]|uniref:FMN-linked oxidoreductase n=1 Tax=Aspergillus steynii IBT 23096 TaxID=1392250 RepID=A0A2I2G2H7_9EURO|nr:FMN-linked oxidoreductase [Aspergillus steynii IBT 23096]PLB47084.1 FMN-linked oxidoreductase [Aspergillus steynii IBT 23096]
MPSQLTDPVKLPCGLVFPNRLVKAAMAEMLAGWSNTPTPDLIEAYNQWGQGGWGSILTGNMQVDINHLGTPFDTSLSHPYVDAQHDAALVETWSRFARAAQQHGTPAVVQLCHPGRQSFRVAGKRGLFAPTIAPSAIPLEMGDSCIQRFVSWMTFPVPREMSQADIDNVTARFVDAARLMADSGFGGIELHGAHGYLLDQFLNPKTNHRTDAYGGTPAKRAKFVLDIIAQIRAVVPPSFCVGIKLNSADHDSASFEDTMMQIGLLVDAGIDFLEVSGGSYQDPQMLGSDPTPNSQSESKSKSTLSREAFFLDFAQQTRSRYPSLTLMLTGGFRTRAGAEAALAQNACDLIGIGRPAAVAPDLPGRILDESLDAHEAGLVLGKVQAPLVMRVIKWLGIKSVGAGVESAYYSGQIGRIAKGLKTVVPGFG